MPSATPAYNLKVVLKETGLADDTLRAWERRYGLPAPERSAGGHRLYSQRDIATIKWLIERQAEGFLISRAVELWNERLSSGTDPLAGLNEFDLTTLQENPTVLTGTTLNAMRARWVTACMKFNEAAAEQALNQAFSIFPVEAVCVNILQKGLAEIGELWYENRASVQQEHFASGLAMRRLNTLLSASPAPSRKQTILVGCPANEWHTFPPLLLSLFLRRRGLNVIHLGANVPSAQFAETANSIHADLVILVSQTLTSAASLQQTALTLSTQHVRLAFGGRIFNLIPDLTKSIQGYFLGQSMEMALNEVDVLLERKTRLPQLKPIPKEYHAAYRIFASKRAEIELTVKQHIQPLPFSHESLMTGIPHLGDNITAALQLGNMAYVSGEMEWLKTLIKAHNHPVEEVAVFMEKYTLAVKQHIKKSGRPIIEWLASVAKDFKVKTQGET